LVIGSNWPGKTPIFAGREWGMVEAYNLPNTVATTRRPLAPRDARPYDARGGRSRE